MNIPKKPSSNQQTRGAPIRFAAAVLALVSLCAFTGIALATEPNSISFTLEGCRNNGDITLPNSGQFICPNAAYTTGNLGKGWNELDLVPYRLTVESKNSAPTTQTYTVAIVLDNSDNSKPGYDVLSVPVLNTAKSNASCSAPTVGAELIKVPGIGGISESRYRLVTITQAKETTCVYDYYGRLALGSHLFPGSSLHANLTNELLEIAEIGARDVSIPVKEISPQELRKDMSAKQDADYAWNLTKTADIASVSFGDVCAAGSEPTRQVTFRVEWEKLAATPGTITVVTNIYAKNPAARTITVNVTDNIYQGTTQTTLLDTQNSGDVPVPANTEKLVLTHTATLPNTDGNIGDWLNDVATATYIDQVTGVSVPGQTTATASAQIASGAFTNTSANITDSEAITGTGLTFSSAQPTLGEFTNYTAGLVTVGPVDWQVLGQTSSGAVDFIKTLYLDGKRITSGTLTDTAKLLGSDGLSRTAGPVSVGITSSASVQLTFSKTIPPVLGSGEKLEVTFHISRAGDPSYSRDEIFTFVAGGPTTQSIALSGLAPDSYTVTETGSVFYPAGCGAVACSIKDPLVSDNPSQTANLSAGGDGIINQCSATLAFTNHLKTDLFATAKVAKVTTPGLPATDPDYHWTFTLNPGGYTATADAGADAVSFEDPTTGTTLPLAEGTYTVTETTKNRWDLTSVANPDGSTATNSCTFTVNYPQDYGKTFTCTFNNTKRGKAEVIKTLSGQPITGADAFTFQLRQGASTTADGTILETQVADATNGGALSFATLLKPGESYQLCEIVMPGWNTNLGASGALFVPNSLIPPTLPNPNVNNMTVCVNFTVAAGATKSFAVDNAPPPGGRALTIGFWKNWASCAGSKGGQQPVLDQTLALATPPGIRYGNYYLIGDPNNPNVAPDCAKAVSLLNKSTFTGKKMASDPLFNLAAQLIAAELNLAAGAYTCPGVVLKIQEANALLSKYGFNGVTYSPKLTATDATAANNLATYLDNYNNNRTGVCP
jgi:hypothetical protein